MEKRVNIKHKLGQENQGCEHGMNGSSLIVHIVYYTCTVTTQILKRCDLQATSLTDLN